MYVFITINFKELMKKNFTEPYFLRKWQLLCCLTLGILFMTLGGVQAQQRKVTGVILDENEMPIPGANVLVKGTSTGSISDLDGNFTMDLTPSEKVLVISYIGYNKTEVDVANKFRAAFSAQRSKGSF